MTLPTYTVPTANSPTTTEEPKIITALTQIKSILNGGIVSANLDSNAQIALSKLESSTSGYILVANGSGVITDVAMSGDVGIAAGGATTVDSVQTDAVDTAGIQDLAVTTGKINTDAVTNAKIGASAVGTTEIADDAVTSAKASLSYVSDNDTTAMGTSYGSYSSVTLATGTWIVMANLHGKPDSSDTIYGDIYLNSVAYFEKFALCSAVEGVSLSWVFPVVAPSSYSCVVRGKRYGGSSAASADTQIVGIRIA